MTDDEREANIRVLLAQPGQGLVHRTDARVLRDRLDEARTESASRLAALNDTRERAEIEIAQRQSERNEAYAKFHAAEDEIIRLEAEITRLRAPVAVWEERIGALRAEIARLQAPPGASAMERAFIAEGYTCNFQTWLNDPEQIKAVRDTQPVARAIEQAEREARAAALSMAERACEGPGSQWDAQARIRALSR